MIKYETKKLNDKTTTDILARGVPQTIIDDITTSIAALTALLYSTIQCDALLAETTQEINDLTSNPLAGFDACLEKIIEIATANAKENIKNGNTAAVMRVGTEWELSKIEKL